MKIFVIHVSEQNLHVKAENITEAMTKTRECLGAQSTGCTIKLELEHSFEYKEGDQYDIA